jgi:F1F0 ATPase subunit 2
MTMNDALGLALALVTGIRSARCSSAAFGGRFARVFRPKQPALWFLGSLLLRTWLVLAGFYFVARGQLGEAARSASLDLSRHA